jgi:hypothetical protein
LEEIMKKALFIGLAMAMVLMFAACATSPPPAAGGGPLSGVWNLNVVTPMGSGTPKFVLEQDGDAVTGTYAGAFGEAPVTGVVAGDAFELEFESMGTKMIYKGTVDDKTMKGDVDLGGQAKGTFTGSKQ